MPHDRFYLDTPFKPQAECEMEGEEAHHLHRVMRKKEGDTVELVNGRSQLATATLIRCDKRSVSLRILAVEERSPFPLSVILCQAIPRFNRLETLVEKGTELGMSELWLFPGDLSEKKDLSPTQLKRLLGITISSMKQCGRLDLPKILLKAPLLKWETTPYPAYFGATTAEAPSLLKAYKHEKNLLFFVGPEAGFSEKEEKELERLKAIGVSLHPNILRTDTASLAALTLLFASFKG